MRRGDETDFPHLEVQLLKGEAYENKSSQKERQLHEAAQEGQISLAVLSARRCSDLHFQLHPDVRRADRIPEI